MKDWMRIFEKEYKPFLNIGISKKRYAQYKNLYQRAPGFEIIFKELLSIKNKDFQIIETGSTRKPGNWKDGNSGIVFSDFVKTVGGFVRSVDINQKAVDTANANIDSDFHKAFCSDSVSWLSSLDNLEKVDLFYLDSYDVDWDNDIPSAEHHLKEFLSIEKFITKDTIIAIDDNVLGREDNKRAGKGRLIFEYLDSKNIKPIYDGYQIIYRF